MLIFQIIIPSKVNWRAANTPQRQGLYTTGRFHIIFSKCHARILVCWMWSIVGSLVVCWKERWWSGQHGRHYAISDAECFRERAIGYGAEG
jgi:hypothetical protein